MADVEMPDASSSTPGKGKASGPMKASSKPGGEGGIDSKRRFEVKKVGYGFRSGKSKVDANHV